MKRKFYHNSLTKISTLENQLQQIQGNIIENLCQQNKSEPGKRRFALNVYLLLSAGVKSFPNNLYFTQLIILFPEFSCRVFFLIAFYLFRLIYFFWNIPVKSSRIFHIPIILISLLWYMFLVMFEKCLTFFSISHLIL